MPPRSWVQTSATIENAAVGVAAVGAAAAVLFQQLVPEMGRQGLDLAQAV